MTFNFTLFFTLCIIPLSVLAKWKYNCVNITALVFPVHKTPPAVWQNIVFDAQDTAEMDKKIAEVEQKLLPSKPKSAEEAYEQFEQMKIKHNVGRAVNTLVLTPDQEFEDKMKLYQIKDFIYLPDMNAAFPFMTGQYPKLWLNERYKYYQFIKDAVKQEIDNADRLRSPKSQTNDDPCYELAISLQENKNWLKGAAKDAHKLVLGCYDTFPFDLKASDVVYDMVDFLSKFYVFANFTTSGTGIPMFIQTLKDQHIPFASNFRFHSYLKNIFNHAGDAHCSYKANCYEQFTFVQPLFLQHYTDGDNNNITINKVSQPGLEEWVHTEVVFIDGKKATDTVNVYANSIGMAYNFNSKLSRAVSRLYWSYKLGDFILERGLFLLRYIAPNRPYLIFGLRKPQTDYVFEVKIDWLIFKADTLVTFSNKYTYWDHHCAAKPFVKKTPKVKRRSLQSKPRLKKRLVSSTPSTINRYTYESTRIIVIGPEFAFLIAKDYNEGDYAILVVNSFNVFDIEGWYLGMQQGFKYLIENDYKKLILELSGNSGGVICLAYALLAVLSPSTEFPFPATKQPYPTVTSPTDMLNKFSTCATEARFSHSPLQIQSYLNEKRQSFQSGASWNDNITSYTKIIGGFSQGSTNFSPYLLDVCQDNDATILKDIKPKFDTLIVLTDTFCGSSCAIVAANLQEVGNPAVVFIPRYTEGKAFPNAYAFAGGQVISLENVKDIAKYSSCFEHVPQTLEELTMTVTYRCIFSLTHPDIPLEFLILPSNESIRHTRLSLESMNERWSKTLSMGVDVQLHPENHYVNTSNINLMGVLMG